MNALAIATLFGKALEAISMIVKELSEPKNDRIDRASDALVAVSAIVDAVSSGRIDDVDLEKANKNLDELVASLSDNDESADAAVDDKFGE